MKGNASVADSWEKPSHHSHSVKCGLTLLCVLLLHLRTPFPIQTKIRKENWLLPAQRISCTVEKTIGIFGMDSGFKNFFPLRILQKAFLYEGFNESCFSLHWSWKRIRMLTADPIYTAIWSHECWTGLSYLWKRAPARSSTLKAKATGFWLHMLCFATIILPLRLVWTPQAMRLPSTQPHLLLRQLVVRPFIFLQRFSSWRSLRVDSK